MPVFLLSDFNPHLTHVKSSPLTERLMEEKGTYCSFSFISQQTAFISHREIVEGILTVSSCSVFFVWICSDRNDLWLSRLKHSWIKCHWLAVPFVSMLPARGLLNSTMMYVAHVIADWSLPSYRDQLDPREKRYASVWISTVFLQFFNNPASKSVRCMDLFLTLIYRQTASERYKCKRTHNLTGALSVALPHSRFHWAPIKWAIDYI